MCSYVAVREMNVIVVYEINRIRTVEINHMKNGRRSCERN